MDKRTIIENYDLVSLAIDEIVDDGISVYSQVTTILPTVN